MAPTSVTTASPLEIRPAERADLLEIYRIERDVFPQPWPYAAFERFLDEPGFLVAVVDDGIVGYVIADVVTEHGRRLGHVKDLAVHPAHRRGGIGSTLLRRALGHLRASGVGTAKLEVRESNGPARSLYRRAGFRPGRRIPGYYEDGEDAIVMVAGL